jgi:ribosome-binding protein aMBF1 (putative translation factor)
VLYKARYVSTNIANFLMVNIKRVIGDNIRGYRQKLDWSREKLAARAKISYDFLGRVERAEQNINGENIHRLAKALKIKPHLLLIEDAFKFPDDVFKLLNKF